MSNRTEVTVTPSSPIEADVATSAAPAPVSTKPTKDAGRVRYGSGMLMFTTTKDTGRVRYGSGMIAF